MIDIGCGAGNILKACLDSGVETVQGVDGAWLKPDMLVIPRENFIQQDITIPSLKDLIPRKNFDITVSSEVAEHIEEKYADIYMDNLTSFSNVILFSAAIPGQGGENHVNEQWQSYWAEKFRARGFIPIDCIRPRIWYDKDIFYWYRQNMLVYIKQECLSDYPALKSSQILDIVHPEKFTSSIAPECFRHMGVFGLCKNIIRSFMYIPLALWRSIRWRILRMVE